MDPTFGSDGKVTTNFLEGSSVDEIQDVAIQPDGKIVAVGSAIGMKRVPVFVVARYNPDGSLDQTFGRFGRVATMVSETGSRATGVALQADGKIVVIGNATDVTGTTAQTDFAVARYDPDGNLDQTFAKGGIVLTDFGGTSDNANDVVIDAKGAILVVGGATGSRQMEVARYNANGTLDKSFGGGGLLIVDAGRDAQSVALQSDGRIVIAGNAAGTAAAGDTNFLIVRLDADGTVDPSFGIGGSVATDFQQGSDRVSALMIQPDGKIIAAGTVTLKRNTLPVFGLARYLPDGTLDTTFGDAGRVVTGLSASGDEGADGQLESDGRIVFLGTSRDEFAIVRYEPDGTIDPTFGTDGVVRANFSTPMHPNTIDRAFAGAIQADGKIVVGGTSTGVSAFTSDAALLRIDVP